MNKITNDYVHVKKSKNSFAIFGIFTCKSKDTTWFFVFKFSLLTEDATLSALHLS